MKKKFVFFIAVIVFGLIFNACSKTSADNQKQTEQPKSAESKTENGAAQSKPNEPAKTELNAATPAKNNPSVDKSACLKAKMDGKKLIADQTFVFDFEPFPKSCFVTFASKEDMVDDNDVPRGSTFHIYKDGEIVYDFEDAFDGQPACWVEGVGFEDLNGDGKKEVIIAGSCLGARDSYPMNAIYENYQDDFHTYASQNEALSNFKTVKQIADYAKKNPKQFFNRR